MSRQMKSFADYFMQGLQLGAGWAEKWQAGRSPRRATSIMKSATPPSTSARTPSWGCTASRCGPTPNWRGREQRTAA